MRKPHPTMMAGTDQVQLPNKPRFSPQAKAFMKKHGIGK